MTLKQKKIMRDEIMPSLMKISDRIMNEVEYPEDDSKGVIGAGADVFNEAHEHFFTAMGMWRKLVKVDV